MERLTPLPRLTHGTPRRGVLLLVVLSLLTLFMMLGATYMVLASRARATARAFASAANGSPTIPPVALGQSFVDEAFMRVVRGSAAGASGVVGNADTLLGDKYGTAASGTAAGTVVSGSGSIILALEASVSGTASAESLAGRVLTFTVPGLRNASVRILRAEPSGGNAKLFIAEGPTLSGENVSLATIQSGTARGSSPHFVINGREFSGSPVAGSSDANEPYDAYDARNVFMANPLSPGSHPSFVTVTGTGANLVIDNDGDGANDSGWLDIGLPPVLLASGTVYPRAAILITDLDGRLNVNAHGSRTELDDLNSISTLYPSTVMTGATGLTTITSATSSFATTPLFKFPRGAGYGPADVSLQTANVCESSGAGSASLILSGITGVSSGVDQSTQRHPPKVGLAEGRYGGRPAASAIDADPPAAVDMPRPGRPFVDDAISSQAQQWVAAITKSYFANPRRFGSPPDLKGSAKVFLDDYGQPVYYKPYWGDVSRADYLDAETIDDPYEVDLSRLGPRSGALVSHPVIRNQTQGGSASDDISGHQIPDNLFSAGDLEGLLRIFDIDSPKLPRRLVALCGDKAGACRRLVTTDSWDSPAITAGAHAAVLQLISFVKAAPGMDYAKASAMFAPETLMGHKMDLNRPFHTTEHSEPNDATGNIERQTFAKHLYTLLYAIAGNGAAISANEAKELAQWAVNIVDFRDSDSVMTGFEFDTDLTDGWNVDGDLSTTEDSDRDIVWGCERPEVLMSETVCWHDRRTDDLNAGTGNETTLVTDTDNERDNDFDQQRRPQGAFFVELYSPWQSQLAEYGASGIKAVRRTLLSGTTASLRAQAAPSDLVMSADAPGGANALSQFNVDAKINLSGTAAGGAPVWRLLTVRRTTAQGVEPSVVDPSATVVSGTAWRTMYFTKPPKTLITGTASNGDSGFGRPAYWPSSAASEAIQLAPQKPLVLGTGTWGATGAIAIDAMYQHPTDSDNTTLGTRPVTLTEPAITAGTNAAQDPYVVLAGTSFNASNQLAPAQDQPLDDKTDATTGILRLVGPDGLRTLFQNGRHANYFFVHLQRLANPKVAWDLNTNPYVTVDTQPVDLVVINLNSAGTNYDEPCVNPLTARTAPAAGGPFSDLRTQQRDYDDPYFWTNGTTASTAASNRISLERGRTQISAAGVDRDIWSARINPKGGSDSLKLLSNDLANSRSSTPVSFPNGNQDGTLQAQPAPLVSAQTLGALAARFGGGTAAPNGPFPWLFWSNRPFVSASELGFVPKGSPFDLLRAHATAIPSGSDALSTGSLGHLPPVFEPVGSGTSIAAPWAVITGRNAGTGEPTNSAPSIWDAVHVPTPFGGSYQNVPTTTSGTAALATIGLDKRPFGQLPNFREPGRINVNTMTGKNVWDGLLGSGTAGTSVKAWGGVTPGATTPVTTLPEALAMVSGTTRFIDSYSEAARSAAANSFFRYQTANRLTNLVTVRSNVFAVWVTIGYSTSSAGFVEAGADTGETRRHRGFYIFDRSIPVGFMPGQDLNVRDAILLRRIIQ